MSFKKIAISTEKKLKLQPLNYPKGWDIYELSSNIKTASTKKEAEEVKLGGFDLDAAINEHPDHLYIKIFAIEKDEVNDNGDAFCEAELKKAASTFIGVPIFTNHQNNDVEKAKGKIVHAWYDDADGGIYIIGCVDKIAYPKLARAIEEKYISGTSMGCFLGNMRVFMHDGSYKRIDEVQPGDRVITHKGRVKPVKNVQIHEDKTDDDIYKIKVEGLRHEICATKEHPFWTLKPQDRCVITGDYLGLPKSYNRFKKRSKLGTYQKPEYATAVAEGEFDKYDFEWKRAEDLTTDDMVAFPVSDVEIPHDDATSDRAKLIGYFLAEGSYIKRKGNRVAVEFNLSSSIEKDTLAAEIISLLRNAFPNHRNEPKTQDRLKDNSKIKRDSFMIRLYGQEIADWFYYYCGDYSHSKRLAPECLFWPKEIQKYIFGSWLNGDGYRRRITHYKNKKQYDNLGGSTASEQLHYQLKFILARLGIYATTQIKKPHIAKYDYNGKMLVKKSGPAWCVQLGSGESLKLNKIIEDRKRVEGSYSKSPFRIAGNYVVMPIKSITTEYNAEPVYNIEVEDDHSYIVEGVAVKNCAVDYSCCSVCHNLAHTASDYCGHVKERKNRKFSGSIDCGFHESPSTPMDDCPLCGRKHGSVSNLSHSDQQVYEHNYGLKFIENSFVVNPACHRCGVCDILHAPTVTTKVADLKEQVKHLFDHSNTFGRSDQVRKVAGSQGKVAGQQELETLKDSMVHIETVVKSMLEQKEQVSMEYVSDLVKTMSDVQNILDELTEMGYGQLPSPAIAGAEDSAPPVEQYPAPEMPQPGAPMGGNQVDVSPSGIANETMGDLGSITRPTFSSNFLNKKKELLKNSSKVKDKISVLKHSIEKISDKRRNKVPDTITEVSESGTGSRRIVISSEEKEGDFYVTEANGDQVIKVSHISEFNKDVQELIKNDPEKAGQQILKELEKDMATTTKEQKSAAVGNPASDSATQTEVITEKQLGSKVNADLHPRTNETWEQITEAEISGSEDADELDDVTSESPQTRKGTYDVITEGQLDTISSGHIARWKDWPEVITEKQWTDFSRWVSAKLPDDWREVITQQQLRELLSNHQFVGPYEVITEGQLKGQDYGIKRWASSTYRNQVMKVAAEAISDAIAKYSKSPQEIKKAVAFATDSNNMSKVAFLTLLNSLPHKKEAIDDLQGNIEYFKKVAASGDTTSALDALILSVAHNGYHGVKIEDAYDAVSYALGNKTAMSKVSERVEQKIAESNVDNSVTDKWAALEEAAIQLDKPEDGLYKVKATIEEIGADISDKKAFVEAAGKFAQSQIGKQAETVTIELNVDFDSQTVDIVQKDQGMATEDELGGVDSLVEELESEPPDIADENGEEDSECAKPMDAGGMSSGDVQNEEIGTGVGQGAGVMTNASKRDNIAKKASKLEKSAQLGGGQMGGQGGAAQGPGAGASLPTPPGAMDQVPPMETFTEQPPGEEGLGGEEDFEPKPPGAMCVVCGSADVDIITGKGKCNNCGSEMNFKVSVDVTRWANLTPESGEEGEEGGEEAFGEGEGFELGDEGGMGGMGGDEFPVAAMVRLSPGALTKIAESDIKIGSVSPANGQTNTVYIGDGNWYCLDTGLTYKVAYATGLKSEKKHAYAQWEWNIKTAKAGCPSCSREKIKFVKALKEAGVTEEQFDAFDIAKKSETILGMKGKGSLQTKTASEEDDILGHYKKAFSPYGDEFPMERCLEKLSNRYGSNALGLSGPCEGKPIADCVCKSLKSAGMYNTGLSIKIAEAWEDKDGTDCCLEDQIRLGLSIKDAESVCHTLKTILASPEDFLADKIAQLVDETSDETQFEDDIDDVDVFDSGDELGEESVKITLELDEDVAQQLDAELSAALGTDDLDVGDEAMVPEEGIEEVAEEPVDVVEEEPKLMTEEPAVEQEAPAEVMKPSTDDPNAAMQGEETKSEPGIIPVEEKGGEIPQVTLRRESGTDEEIKEAETEEYPYEEAMHMHGRIGKTKDIHLDLDKVVAAVNKTAGEKEVEHQNVQDGEETKPYSAGNPADGGHSSEMFHENETVPTATKPSVPRNEALMGHEDDAENANPQDKPQPVIPSENATMGHEDEAGLSGGDHRYTGGDEGAGKTNTASSEEEAVLAEVASMRGWGKPKDRMTRLAERILEAQNKKLEPKKPVADDEDIKPISDGGTMGHEPKFTADTPTNTETANNSHMGHEKESLGDKPTSPKDHPELPADDARMGHEEQEVAPEKQTRDKGTVIAESDGESETHKESHALAFRVAADMLQSGLLEASQLEGKVSELSKYEPAQIEDYRKIVAKTVEEGKKGFNTASEGLERPLVINEASSIRNGSDELQSKLASLFTLSKRNTEAEETPDFALRRVFR